MGLDPSTLSELYPTLEALRPPPGIEEFVKHADRLVKTITLSARPADNTNEPQNVVFGVDKSMTPIFTKYYSTPRKTTKQRVFWFHERFNKEAHTCEGKWCSMYKDGISVRKHKQSGNEKGEQD